MFPAPNGAGHDNPKGPKTCADASVAGGEYGTQGTH